MSGCITEKIIKPSRCVLAFGIPTCKKDFFEDQKSDNKDFAKLFKKNWSLYYDQVIFYLEQLEQQISQPGATIIKKLTLSNFGQLLSNKKFDVVILFSHWKENSVEFYDGLQTTSKIINEVPTEFSGIIDLCVCNPKELRIALDIERPNCVVKFADKEELPFFWLNFYRILFKYLQQKNKNYIEAVDIILETFNKDKKELYYEKIRKCIQRLFRKSRNV